MCITCFVHYFIIIIVIIIIIIVVVVVAVLVVVVVIIIIPSSAVLLNCLYLNPWVLVGVFSPNSLPHPTMAGLEGEQAAVWCLVAD